MGSVWEIASSPASGIRSGPPESAHHDVVIVGAGITGLSVALHLAEAGRRVLVLEARRIGQSNTGHSTGNLYSTVAGGLTPIADKWDEETAQAVVAARTQALDTVEATIERHGIDCGFERRPLHFVTADDGWAQWLEREQAISRRAGIETERIDRAPLPFETAATLRLERQAQYNPLRYAQGLAAAVIGHGGAIHEYSPVRDIDTDRGCITVGDARITARCVVQATHTPKGINILQTAMLPYREYGIAARLAGASRPEGAFWLLDSGHSVRGYHHDGDDYLVVVGHKHRTGEAPPDAQPYERLREYARAHFDIASFEHEWSAQQFTAADRLPYIGPAPGAEGTHVATGYAADGLVWGTLAGSIIGDLVLERDNPWAARYSPSRLTPARSARQWLEENASVASHFARDRLGSEQIDDLGEIAPGEGRIASLDGEKLAVCRDLQGHRSVLSAECPHMKCLVQWNAADATWDCPCHGSRFRADGTVIEGPACHDLAPRSRES